MRYNGNKFSVYESEEKTVLGLLDELGSQVNHNTDNLKAKTDLYGDHKGSWQGLSRPTMVEEGMRATVEDIIDNKIPSINSSLETITRTKRNKSDLIKSSELDKSSDTFKIKKDNLSEEVLEMLVPNSNITISGVVDNLSLVREKYAINSIGVEQVDFLNSTNLINPKTIKKGYFINPNTGLETENALYNCTDFIPVRPGETLSQYMLWRTFFCFYDKNKKWLGTLGVTELTDLFNVPNNAYYFRATTKDEKPVLSRTQNVITDYIPYKLIFSDDIEIEIDCKNKYKGMDVISFGDSTVFQNKWQPKLISYLGLGNHTICGVSGSRISGTYQYHNAMWTDERLNTLPNNSEFNGLLFLLGGINDWSQNVPLGEITSKNTDEFYGALNILIPKLVQKYPKAKIIILSTTWAFMPDRDMFDDKTGITNRLGLLAIDYGQAMIRIAKRYGLKYVDLSGLGWNNYNYSYYIPDKVHPNEIGGELIANEIKINIL